MQHQVDPLLEPFAGPEATVTLSFTWLVAWSVLMVLRFLWTRASGRGRGSAVADHDDQVLKEDAQQHYDATVLLIGPKAAGKTRLFYQL